MINILFPINKSVPSEYNYYALFLNRLSDLQADLNINVTYLLFSKHLINQVKSKIIILGEGNLYDNKSINELENDYEFSFREILYTDLLQTTKFIQKTRGRNWYIPEVAFIEKEMQGVYLTESEFSSGQWIAKCQDLLNLNRVNRSAVNGAEQIGGFIRHRLL